MNTLIGAVSRNLKKNSNSVGIYIARDFEHVKRVTLMNWERIDEVLLHWWLPFGNVGRSSRGEQVKQTVVMFTEKLQLTRLQLAPTSPKPGY